ncbi:hypothetical protein [Halolamina sp.]|uniref:hypothetical protein n=1 Tax=Halolamina sp. TaxID=1940283 RepID=UPI000223BDBF|nr:hypothetical protein Halar_2585 [halophilic archaeon DL31]
MTDHDAVQQRVTEYWEWVAVALFLLLSVDLLTSLFAAAAVGVGAEANPLMAYLLAQPLEVLLGVHLGVTVLAVGFFDGLMRTYVATPARFRRPYGYLIELWLGLLLAVGLSVFANNLSVIVLGAGLF